MNIALRTAQRAGFAEVFVTATADDAALAESVFASVATALRTHGVEPLRERLYGASAARDRLLAARERQYAAHDLDPTTPVGFVDGASPGGGDFAGVQIAGVQAPAGGAVRTVPGGRLWQGPTFRMLHLCGIAGPPGEPVTVQAERMFAAAAAAAHANGFEYRQTVRTWIYLARLLDWYGEFNRVRNLAYRAHDFAFPASTGIQGRCGGAECTMDVLLVDGAPCRPIERTMRQGPARAYGSAFARGVQIGFHGGTTVHVSGTASLDGNGRSLHADDPVAQSAEMLLGVGAVLAEAGLGLADVQQATLFCKHAAAAAAFRQVHTLLGLPAFPTVVVGADVCRPELLIEMEAIACR